MPVTVYIETFLFPRLETKIYHSFLLFFGSKIVHQTSNGVLKQFKVGQCNRVMSVRKSSIQTIYPEMLNIATR